MIGLLYRDLLGWLAACIASGLSFSLVWRVYWVLVGLEKLMDYCEYGMMNLSGIFLMRMAWRCVLLNSKYLAT